MSEATIYQWLPRSFLKDWKNILRLVQCTGSKI